MVPLMAKQVPKLWYGSILAAWLSCAGVCGAATVEPAGEDDALKPFTNMVKIPSGSFKMGLNFRQMCGFDLVILMPFCIFIQINLR